METFLTNRGWILSGGISELEMTVKTITTVKLIQQAWTKASAAEKKLITSFVEANSASGNQTVWFLAMATNLDTGRQFLAAGYSIASDVSAGVSLSQLRQAIGLPPHKETSSGKHKDSRRDPPSTHEAPESGADTGDRKGPSTGRGKQIVQGLDEVSSSTDQIEQPRRPLSSGGRRGAR